MASPTPVLPEVGSTIVPPLVNSPSRSAASIMAMAGRSLTLPPGLRNSSLANSCAERSRADAVQPDEGRVPDQIEQ